MSEVFETWRVADLILVLALCQPISTTMSLHNVNSWKNHHRIYNLYESV